MTQEVPKADVVITNPTPRGGGVTIGAGAHVRPWHWMRPNEKWSRSGELFTLGTLGTVTVDPIPELSRIRVRLRRLSRHSIQQTATE